MTGRVARILPLRILFAWFPIACLCGASLSFLGTFTAQAAFADIELPQANGGSLILPAQATRIVTLAPNLAELVFAAGAGDSLRAVVEYSNFPPKVIELPRVGDAFRIDLERIIELEPDLVIGWKSGNPQTALLKLEQLGFKVWQIEITRPEAIADVVENIALAAGTLDHGTQTSAKLRGRLRNLQRQYAHRARVEFFYQIAPRPLYTINGQHIISRSLEVCGGHNIFADLGSLAPQISRESVILANPHAMIAPEIAGDPPALADWKRWPQLQAVQNDALLYLPADDISRAAPRLLDGIELACKLLDEVRSRQEIIEH